MGMGFNGIWMWTPLILDIHGRLTGELKPKQDWDKANNKGSEVNVRALFSIFNIICPNEFRKIANCSYVKKAWDGAKKHEHTL